MRLAEIARRAGVSTSTVSRAFSAHPSVSEQTLAAVRQAAAELGATSMRITARRRTAVPSRGTRIGLIAVASAANATASSDYQRLLAGALAMSEQIGVKLQPGFAVGVRGLMEQIDRLSAGGLLLAGELDEPLPDNWPSRIPAVWMMAGRRRAPWGDQVMPDNSAIGIVAAKHLLQKNHKHLAYAGTDQAWYLNTRGLAFSHTIEQAGKTCVSLCEHLLPGVSMQRIGMVEAAHAIAARLLELRPQPTGIFVGEEWLVPLLSAALEKHRVRLGIDIDLVTCCTNRAYLIGLPRQPAVIEVLPEVVGREAVRHLLWRMTQPGLDARLRVMLEPRLIPAED